MPDAGGVAAPGGNHARQTTGAVSSCGTARAGWQGQRVVAGTVAVPELTEQEFRQAVAPYLSTARHGYVSALPLYRIFNCILFKLVSGCPWSALPPGIAGDNPVSMSYQVPYYHFRKWLRDGSLRRLVAAQSIAGCRHQVRPERLVAQVALAEAVARA